MNTLKMSQLILLLSLAYEEFENENPDFESNRDYRGFLDDYNALVAKGYVEPMVNAPAETIPLSGGAFGGHIYLAEQTNQIPEPCVTGFGMDFIKGLPCVLPD